MKQRFVPKRATPRCNPILATLLLLSMLAGCAAPDIGMGKGPGDDAGSESRSKSLVADGFIASLQACGERRALSNQLAESYGEAPVWIGLRRDGAVVEIFAGADGTWTRILVAPNGIACLVGSGVGGQTMGSMTPGTDS